MKNTSDTEIIVVRVAGKHPHQKMNRAGFTFFQIPTAVEATAEQIEIIKGDAMLIIVEEGKAGYEEAIKGLENSKKSAEQLAQEAEEQAAVEAERIEKENEEKAAQEEAANAQKIADDEATAKAETEDAKTSEEGKKDEENHKSISAMNKDELIAELEKKGKKAGTDFDPEATKASLKDLLVSLSS